MRSEEPSEPYSVRGLSSVRSTERINQIDQVRAFGIGDVVSLPQLVVCGDQSAGKSSVLESVTGIPFPRKSGLCTRFPTEIILRHNSKATQITATVQPHASRLEEKKNILLQYRRVLKDMSELPGVIEEVSALMEIRGYGNHSTGNAFASDVLRIEFTGQTNLNLTIVDLPGLISVANEEQSEEDIQVVKDMVKGYVQSSRTIVLAVVQATNDIANQVIIQLARQYDPEGERTVGIITKADLINEGSEASLAQLANNQANIKLNLGFFLLKNPKPSEMEEGINPKQRSERELRFFSEPVWKQHLDMSRVGAENLKLFLQDLLDSHIEKEMPKVIEDIKKVLHITEESLTRLGQARPTTGHIRIFLTQVSTSFSQLVQAALDGNYHGPYYGFFDSVVHSRLRAVVHEINGEFATAIRTHGKKRVLRPAKSETGWGRDENSIKENSEEDHFVYLGTRGRELPGNYNHVLLAELFMEQSSRWLPIAKTHVESVIATVTRWLQDAARMVLPEDKIRTNVLAICFQWVEAAGNSASIELNKLKEDEQRQPITYNHYYTDNIQKSRHGFFREAVEAAIKETASTDYHGKFHVSNIPVDFARFFEAMKSKVNVDMDDQACAEALAGLEAYYKVAMKTFVDNVCRQVVERHIIAPLPEIFSPVTVSRFTDDELRRIGAEPEKQNRKREELNTRAQKLRSSLANLQRH
ncbi:uncharacterized protein PpBr36_10767 [Pyricularia pennisetigena]|uniref:uncharacterized protein n=1 Tax=Pyricularia pennisetigena TaxID=1578925 RepID=UPI0011526794|nr:uncharacterized protein PpBr36_10767 [Pyricularia pennisetigena]TLS21024.1 hypothetical protein PpBr36_10767 [Pyricularia pennisetigena]